MGRVQISGQKGKIKVPFIVNGALVKISSTMGDVNYGWMFKKKELGCVQISGKKGKIKVPFIVNGALVKFSSTMGDVNYGWMFKKKTWLIRVLSYHDHTKTRFPN